MHEAVRKSHLVKTKLTNLTSEIEFWEWYKKEIEENSQLVNDRITFAEAIKKVEDDFWNSLSRTKRERDRNSPSDITSWYDTYELYYKKLPMDAVVNLRDILSVIKTRKKGKRSYIYAISAMKKLVRLNKRHDILESLNELDLT